MQNCGVLLDEDNEDDPLPIHHELATTSMPEAWVKAATGTSLAKFESQRTDFVWQWFASTP